MTQLQPRFFVFLNKALLFLIKLNKTVVHSVPKIKIIVLGNSSNTESKTKFKEKKCFELKTLTKLKSLAFIPKKIIVVATKTQTAICQCVQNGYLLRSNTLFNPKNLVLVPQTNMQKKDQPRHIFPIDSSTLALPASKTNTKTLFFRMQCIKIGYLVFD